MIDQIGSTPSFDRALKRLRKKHYDLKRLKYAIHLIQIEDHETLKRQFDWHMLVGNHAGINEIHIEKNWLLLYQVLNGDELKLLLIDTGDHSIL